MVPLTFFQSSETSNSVLFPTLKKRTLSSSFSGPFRSIIIRLVCPGTIRMLEYRIFCTCKTPLFDGNVCLRFVSFFENAKKVIPKMAIPANVPMIKCLFFIIFQNQGPSLVLFPVSCFPFPVPCFLFPVSCFLFPVSRFLFPVSCFPFPVSCVLCPISCFL